MILNVREADLYEYYKYLFVKKEDLETVLGYTCQEFEYEVTGW